MRRLSHHPALVIVCERTSEHVWRIYLVRLARLRDRHRGRDLDKVRAAREVRQAGRHDPQELRDALIRRPARDGERAGGRACWVSSWSWVMRSMCVSSCCIAAPRARATRRIMGG
jgi:hypothetical protein